MSSTSGPASPSSPLPFTVEGLTVADFNSSGWEQILTECAERHCTDYLSAFGRAAREATTAGNQKHANLLLLLQAVTIMHFDHGDRDSAAATEELFEPMIAFDAPSLAYLSDILPHVMDPELRARIADILWVYRRDHKAAREHAVPAYLAAAEPFQTTEKWPCADDRISRAFDIAMRLRDPDLIASVVTHVERVLAETADNEDAEMVGTSFFPARLMGILQNHKEVDHARYGILAEKIAKLAEVAREWVRAREYWDMASQWHRLAKDDAKVLAARICAAETFAKEAEEAASRGENAPSHAIAAHWMECAVQAYRELRALKGANKVALRQREDELHHRLLDFQAHIPSETVTITHKVDITDAVEQVVKLVEGKDLIGALLTLALGAGVPKRSYIRGLVREERAKYLGSQLFGTTVTDRRGRTVVQRDAIGILPASTADDQENADLLGRMFARSKMIYASHAQVFIEPLRERILLDHRITVDDFLAIVTHSPFVPEGREALFARGLYAGLRGDLAVSMHLLLPQVENSLRELAERAGCRISKLEQDGTQPVQLLNSLLSKDEFPVALTKVIGEDAVFGLRGLLVEGEGGNIRNRMAHGLMDYAEFFTFPCLYLWWLIFRLCCAPVLVAFRRSEKEDEDSVEDVESTTE